MGEFFKRKEVQEWGLALVGLTVVAILITLSSNAFASDGKEFEEATGQVEKWIGGNLGKLASLVALAVGAFVAIVQKSPYLLVYAIALAMMIQIALGIVDNSYTALI